MGAEIGQELHQCAAESAVDDVEGGHGGEIDEKERRVAQESVRERNTTCVLWGIARAHELDALKANPSVVAGSPEST